MAANDALTRHVSTNRTERSADDGTSEGHYSPFSRALDLLSYPIDGV
ncbi:MULTISPECIES: hypothetical protein [unclassified Haladaptatus]|nr:MULTISPECIES: hypothetical protein [unclassified Haladaptatus]MCO8242830.1 hypothetical protein [Haladaptatus sp. AB643]MCO8252590.1 hypothetical protein [Haladaptatus sp. AB618]